MTMAVLAAAGSSLGLALAVVTLGLGFRPVLSGSMRPTFQPGAVVVTEEVPVRSIHPGTIIVFSPPGERAEYAHRVTSVSGPASHPDITTKGDANPAPDPWHVRLASARVPVVVASLPWVGRLMVGVSGPVHLILMLVGGLTVGVYGTRRILRPTSRPPTVGSHIGAAL